MHVSGHHLIVHEAFKAASELIAVSGENFAERCGDILCLAAMVFKSDCLECLPVHGCLKGDIADAAVIAVGAFGVVIKEAKTVNCVSVLIAVILSKQLISPADQQERCLFFHRFGDIVASCQQILINQTLLIVRAAAHEEQIIIADIALFPDGACVDSRIDAALFAADLQYLRISFVTIEIHEIMVHPENLKIHGRPPPFSGSHGWNAGLCKWP